MKKAGHKTIKVTRKYMEMCLKPANRISLNTKNVEILELKKPDVDIYRFLFDATGGDLGWTDRKLLSDSELSAIINNENTSIIVLTFEGQYTGFAELMKYKNGDTELKYFGLMPTYRGKGLGKYFLNAVLHKAWDSNPKRIILNTCDIDHPAAIPVYQKAGFSIYKTEEDDQVVL